MGRSKYRLFFLSVMQNALHQNNKALMNKTLFINNEEEAGYVSRKIPYL